MSSVAMVQLALNLLSCNQKELAARLKVSPTQVSKWKSDDVHMSADMEEKFRRLLQIGDLSPEVILQAGGLDAAAKWERLIQHIAMMAEDAEETGYETYPLKNECGMLCWHTFATLNEMGVEIPKSFPAELEFNFDDPDVEWDIIHDHPIASLIYKIFKALTDVYGFYVAYVADLMSDESLDLMATLAVNIEPELMSLAASKLDADENLATKFRKFRHRVERDFEEWLDVVKDTAIRARVPLRIELMDLIHKSHDAIGHQAEAESLGFTKGRLHPDIYMNELLVGMRLIQKALPAIIKKLDIKPEL